MPKTRFIVPDTAIATFAGYLIHDSITKPRNLLLRINNALGHAGARKISKRSERTATEILYFLFQCQIMGQSASVSDVYLSTGLARGTAIRCIANLKNLGVIETVPDGRDKRRSLIHMTKPYQRIMTDFSEGYFVRLRELLALARIAEPPLPGA
jgi:DNA-binding MarR family transcriptional regulator